MRTALMNALQSRSYVLDILVAFLLIVTIFFLVGERNLSSQLRNIAEENHTLSVQNQTLLQEVDSCTNPSGVCYKAGTARTKGVVDQINHTTVLSAFCSTRVKYKYPQDVRKCIRQLKGE